MIDSEYITVYGRRLAGVIYEGPNQATDEGEAIDGLEVIKARRAHFILPDGQLDIPRWRTLQTY